MRIWRAETTYRCLECKIEREQQIYSASLSNKLDDISGLSIEKDCPWCDKPMAKLKIVCEMKR